MGKDTINMEILSERMAKLQAERDEYYKLDDSKTVIVNKDGAFIRIMADNNSIPIGRLGGDEKVEIEDVVVGVFVNNSDLWYKVNYGIKQGYIHSSLARPER